MTTASQVKRALKPLLLRHPDLALVNRTIVVKPVRHVLRGILIDRTGNVDRFTPKWFAVHLFEQLHFTPLSWGSEIHRRSPSLWRWSNPQDLPLLFEKIETEALPQLQTISTIDSFADFVSAHRFRHQLFEWPHRKVILDVAQGNLDSARTICARSINCRDEETYGRDEEDRAQLRRLKQLCSLLADDDRAGMAKLLHEWEAQTVRNLKIEHLWEPTPFPLETMG